MGGPPRMAARAGRRDPRIGLPVLPRGAADERGRARVARDRRARRFDGHRAFVDRPDGARAHANVQHARAAAQPALRSRARARHPAAVERIDRAVELRVDRRGDQDDRRAVLRVSAGAIGARRIGRPRVRRGHPAAPVLRHPGRRRRVPARDPQQPPQPRRRRRAAQPCRVVSGLRFGQRGRARDDLDRMAAHAPDRRRRVRADGPADRALRTHPADQHRPARLACTMPRAARARRAAVRRERRALRPRVLLRFRHQSRRRRPRRARRGPARDGRHAVERRRVRRRRAASARSRFVVHSCRGL